VWPAMAGHRLRSEDTASLPTCELESGFLFVSDANVLFGFGEPQAAGSFNNSALKGTYAGFTANPADFGVVVFSGEFSATAPPPPATSPAPKTSAPQAGPVSGAAFQATYSVPRRQPMVRGIMTITPAGGTAVIYMISATKFVAVVSQNDPNPAILDFEYLLFLLPHLLPRFR